MFGQEIKLKDNVKMAGEFIKKLKNTFTVKTLVRRWRKEARELSGAYDGSQNCFRVINFGVCEN